MAESTLPTIDYDFDQFRKMMNDHNEKELHFGKNHIRFEKQIPEGVIVMLPNENSDIMHEIARNIHHTIDHHMVPPWPKMELPDLKDKAIVCKLPTNWDLLPKDWDTEI
jgi:hypothetical protein